MFGITTSLRWHANLHEDIDRYQQFRWQFFRPWWDTEHLQYCPSCTRFYSARAAVTQEEIQSSNNGGTQHFLNQSDQMMQPPIIADTNNVSSTTHPFNIVVSSTRALTHMHSPCFA